MASKQLILQPLSVVVSVLFFAKVTLLSPLLARSPAAAVVGMHAGTWPAAVPSRERASNSNHISVLP